MAVEGSRSGTASRDQSVCATQRHRLMQQVTNTFPLLSLDVSEKADAEKTSEWF